MCENSQHNVITSSNPASSSSRIEVPSDNFLYERSIPKVLQNSKKLSEIIQQDKIDNVDIEINENYDNYKITSSDSEK